MRTIQESTRKPYHEPRLEVYGDVAQITQMPPPVDLPPGKTPCDQDNLGGIGLGASCIS